eukprot:10370455-Alexandrium_andersonii.AAC.1
MFRTRQEALGRTVRELYGEIYCFFEDPEAATPVLESVGEVVDQQECESLQMLALEAADGD